MARQDGGIEEVREFVELELLDLIWQTRIDGMVTTEILGTL